MSHGRMWSHDPTARTQADVAARSRVLSIPHGFCIFKLDVQLEVKVLCNFIRDKVKSPQREYSVRKF